MIPIVLAFRYPVVGYVEEYITDGRDLEAEVRV